MGVLKPFLSGCDRLRSRASSFAAQSRGSVLVESAFIIPILLLLVMGGIEVSRFILMDQKLARVASNAADLTARTVDPTVADIQQVFSAVEYIAKPFELDDDDIVIISSVSRPVGATSTQVDWQETGGGGGSEESRIGATGETADLPAVLNLREGQALIVGEAFYEYEPFFFEGFIDPRTVYHVAFYRPRDVVLALGVDDGTGGGGDGGGGDGGGGDPGGDPVCPPGEEWDEEDQECDD